MTPLFTCFGYANLGLPLNPRDAIYYQTTPDPFGFTPNPFGFAFRDLGLGTFLRSGPGSAPNPNADWLQLAPTVDGQMQVMTARNVAMTPPQCPTTEAGQTDANGQPIPYFQKEFFHNGYAKSLKQLVHFYNTRDVFPFNVTSGNCPEGTTEKVDCWPMPEVPNNIDMTVGNLGLTDEEEDLIVIFLQTLTDGFTTPYPDIDTFTGTCMTGGSAATQGNEFLIPTPDASALRTGDLRRLACARSAAYSLGPNAARRMQGGRAERDMDAWGVARDPHAPGLVFSKGTAIGGLSMHRLLLKLAITATVGTLLSSTPTVAQLVPPAKKAERVEITQGPALEVGARGLRHYPVDHQQPWGDGGAFRRRALRYGSQGPEPDGEISAYRSTGAMQRRCSACACPVSSRRRPITTR